MKFALLLALAFITAFSTAAQAQSRGGKMKYVLVPDDDYAVEPNSTARPNAISVELGGRTGILGFTYDRSVGESVGLGIGSASYGIDVSSSSGSTGGVRITLVPLFGNFYFQPDRHRGFLSAGGTLVHLSAQVNDVKESNSFYASGSGFLPTLGGGYEFRGDGGFIFRASLYAFFGGRNATFLWPGITLGGTF